MDKRAIRFVIAAALKIAARGTPIQNAALISQKETYFTMQTFFGSIEKGG